MSKLLHKYVFFSVHCFILSLGNCLAVFIYKGRAKFICCSEVLKIFFLLRKTDENTKLPILPPVPILPHPPYGMWDQNKPFRGPIKSCGRPQIGQPNTELVSGYQWDEVGEAALQSVQESFDAGLGTRLNCQIRLEYLLNTVKTCI